MCNEKPRVKVWEKHKTKFLEAPKMGYDGIWYCVSFALLLIKPSSGIPCTKWGSHYD